MTDAWRGVTIQECSRNAFTTGTLVHVQGGVKKARETGAVTTSLKLQHYFTC